MSEPTPELPPHTPLPAPDRWPEINREAFHGPIGRLVQRAAPFTEADPVAVLMSLLVAVGVCLGRFRYITAGNDPHPAALFATIVGDSSKAGKGTSLAVARLAIQRLSHTLIPPMLGGFGSGEALIDAVRDPRSADDEDAPIDQRAIIVETEFARLLRVVGREGSTLGPVMRNAWDGSRLEARSRGAGPVWSTNYHVGVISHITGEEVRKTLSSTEIYGGTGNRFLFTCARRTQLLPDGGNVPEHFADEFAEELSANLRTLPNKIRLERDVEANAYWHRLYREMADDDPPGLVGALVARAPAQVLRLSVVYALADGEVSIGVEHVEAAWAVWRYCRASVDYVFGGMTGNKDADRILAALREAPAGMRRELVSKSVFSGHLSSKALQMAIDELVAAGLIEVEVVPTSGRPKQVLHLAEEAK